MTVNFPPRLILLILSWLVPLTSFTQQAGVPVQNPGLKNTDSLLLALQSNTKEDTNRINSLLSITEYYISIQKYKELFPFSDEAVRLAQIKQNEIKKTAACYYASFAKYIAGEYENSLTYALEGIEAAQKYPDARMEIKLNAIACRNLMNQERYADASVYAFAGLQKAADIKDSTAMAKSHQLISTCFFYQDKFEDALTYTLNAYTFYKTSGQLPNILESCNSIGEIHLKLGRPDKAIFFYNEALNTINKLGDEAPAYAVANNNSYHAEAYEKKGDAAGNTEAVNEYYNKALVYYLQSIQQWQKIDSTGNFGVAASVIGDLKVQTGSLLYKMKRFADSRKYISQGITASIHTDSRKSLSNGYLVLSNLDSLAGDHISSYKNYKLHIRYKDSIYNLENSKMLEVYRNRSEAERKDKELQLQIADGNLKSALAQKRKQQLLFAWIMAGLILSGASFAFYRYRRLSKIKAEQKLLKDRLAISQDLHDNIGSTLSSIAVYSQLAKMQGEKTEKEDLNELLEKIGSTSTEMVTEMNDIVWAINPRNDNMEKIIQRMGSFAKPLAAARNIRFELTCNRSIDMLQLDMGKRKNFFLIFKEAVNNAIKYSAATNLAVDIYTANHQLVLTVKDNGVGFNPETEMAGNRSSLSGNGLKNMQERAKELNAVLSIQSRPGNGTNIMFQLPLA